MNEHRHVIRSAVLSALALCVLAPSTGAARAQDFPSASPAAGRIVYSRQAVDTFDMFTADPDGADEARLLEIDESPAGEDQPRWSPDGRRVAFATYRDGAAVIHVLSVEDGELRTVVDRDGTSGDASWSPDGRCLAYEGGQADDPALFDVKVWCDDGAERPGVQTSSPARNVTNTPSIDERDPEWSPDGARILFAARSNAAATTDRWVLTDIAVDGTDRRTVLALPDEHARFPRYSPDGERIGLIASRQNLPFGMLSVFERSTGAITPLCELASDSWSWSPDGTELLFANIANSGVRLAPPGLSSAPNSSNAPYASFATPLRWARTASTQYKGLYRVDLASRSVARLRGAAGGAEAPNVPTNFEFGFMPDWTKGTATPGIATATPTVEATPSPAPSHTPTVALSPSPSPSPSGGSSTPAGRSPHRIFLPRLFLPRRR
ncbi:MAG: hypothetical protein ABI780_02000 [Ardenticatenales bacterium]